MQVRQIIESEDNIWKIHIFKTNKGQGITLKPKILVGGYTSGWLHW